VFPESTLIMQRREWEAAMASPQNPFNPIHKFELLDGDNDLFGDGSLTILSTPGYTMGHQSLLVHLNKPAMYC
jgi:N-acyl homoserine lactone hydrolase